MRHQTINDEACRASSKRQTINDESCDETRKGVPAPAQRAHDVNGTSRNVKRSMTKRAMCRRSVKQSMTIHVTKHGQYAITSATRAWRDEHNMQHQTINDEACRVSSKRQTINDESCDETRKGCQRQRNARMA